MTIPFDQNEILNGIRGWVELESPTDNPEAVNRLMDKVASDYQSIGATIERVPGRDGFGDHLIARVPGADGTDPSTPGILILSHLDTVHPYGTLATLPFRVEGDYAYGPGISDMKGGAFLTYWALRHLAQNGERTPLPLTHLLVSDEEVGSPTSRDLIESLAREAKYVLVTEPAREGGKIVTARKGTARFEMTVKGRPAHSGSRHQDGRSAIKELARQILILEDMTDYDREVTVNVGVISGGTRENVIPENAWALIDMRVPSPEIAEEMVPRVLGLKAIDPDVEVTVTGEMNRPAYEKLDDIAMLFDHAKALASEIGFDLKDVKTGGGSDGNFTASITPTLDGLGVDGEGAHTNHERIFISSLVPRASLQLRLMETLT